MAFWKSPVDGAGPSPSPLAPWCQVADLSDRQTGGWVIVQHLPGLRMLWPLYCFIWAVKESTFTFLTDFSTLFLLVTTTFKHDFRFSASWKAWGDYRHFSRISQLLLTEKPEQYNRVTIQYCLTEALIGLFCCQNKIVAGPNKCHCRVEQMSLTVQLVFSLWTVYWQLT